MIEKDSNVEYVRDIDQATIPHDKRIAHDDGVPISQLDIKHLEDTISKTTCRGTYSYLIETVDGDKTRVAIKVINGPNLR